MIFRNLLSRTKADFDFIRRHKYKPVSVDYSKYQQADIEDIQDRISLVYCCEATLPFTLKIIALNEMN